MNDFSKPLISSILIQIPLGYFFISLESLVVGQGLIGLPNGIGIYMFANIFISTVIIIVLGLPIYLAFHHYKMNSTSNVALVGFFIPIVILCIINFSSPLYSGYSAGENYYGTYRDMVIDGKRTIWGFVHILEEMLTFGIHGLLGAITFHKLYITGKNV